MPLNRTKTKPCRGCITHPPLAHFQAHPHPKVGHFTVSVLPRLGKTQEDSGRLRKTQEDSRRVGKTHKESGRLIKTQEDSESHVSIGDVVQTMFLLMILCPGNVPLTSRINS